MMPNKFSGLATLAFSVLAVPALAVAQAQSPAEIPPRGYWPGPWHMWSGGYGWSFPWWMCAMMIMVMLIVGVAICWLGRGTFGHRPHGWRSMISPGGPKQSALQTLSERFARGEIQEDEYMQRKLAILEGKPA
jgi:putative membrane protein